MVKVTSVTGPDPVAFIYLRGEIEGFPQVTQTRSVACAALASGALTIAAEKAALIADVEQALTNWQAAQAALEEL
jgi:hypothetical protein